MPGDDTVIIYVDKGEYFEVLVNCDSLNCSMCATLQMLIPFKRSVTADNSDTLTGIFNVDYLFRTLTLKMLCRDKTNQFKHHNRIYHLTTDLTSVRLFVRDDICVRLKFHHACEVNIGFLYRLVRVHTDVTS